ncbi:MAG TPA: DUF885 family protein [Pyrinomonadaceae bacterium]|jgi:uncharacterized protein (DUF885 family)|nr:DUF885 family protein [Pyrinomonadaceae bacterium]
MSSFRRSLIVAVAVALLVPTTFEFRTSAQKQKTTSASSDATVDNGTSEMRPIIEYYIADRGSLQRSFFVNNSPARRERFRKFFQDALDRIQKLNFDAMSEAGKVDYILFRNHLEHELRQLDIEEKQQAEIAPLIPFGKTIVDLEEARRRMDPIDPAKAATTLNALKKQAEDTRRQVEAGLRGGENPEAIKPKKTVAFRAVNAINSLRGNLRNWYTFYNGYDPVFTWWAEQPEKELDDAMSAYATLLNERIVGVRSTSTGQQGQQGAGPRGGAGPGGAGGQGPGGGGGFQRPGAAQARPGDNSDIIGDPIGRDALISELQYEMIPYTPEELIAFAEKEFAWCENEMKKASRELGYGDDWKKALEHVKNLYVDPGKQPELIRDLALEAIKYVDDHDLITVPQLARDTWRMEMMTPERQLVSPFFLGGETILVSYPTNTMSHEQKMMSMRGNNPHFSRATVFHELIPGHHLQGFMNARYKPYRGLFGTPFWTEGGALYWELLFWDMGFPKTPENKIGMLFWHMHRCARIIFSLSFHLEKMTPQQCIDFLVDRVGHERDNATAEVRRSFDGSYGPLYQISYLIGAKQFYALHHELVDSGKMKNREYHDLIYKENRIPVEMVRAILTNQKLTRDFKTSWRFLPN